MTSQVTTAFTTLYAKEVAMEAQQLKSKLRDHVTIIPAKDQTVSVPRMEAVAATRGRLRHNKLQSIGTDQDRVSWNVTSVYAVEKVDSLDELQTNVALRKFYTDNLLAAVNRDIDSQIIEAVVASATEVSVSNALNAAGLIAIGKSFNAADIPFEDRVGVVSPGGWEDLISDQKFTSKDYVRDQYLANGAVPNVLGFNLVMSTLLSAGSSGKKNLFWQKKAVALAMNQDVTTRIDYLADEDSYQIMVKCLVGAKVLRTEQVFFADIAN